jgi:DNA-binding GntR family transcriptional regulator
LQIGQYWPPKTNAPELVGAEVSGIAKESSGPTVSRNMMLSSQVRQILLEQILRGDYQPGERLVETRLARELGVSQGTVREGLRALEGLGFVESAPYRGVRVRGAISYEEMAAVHPVRAVLEDLAARSAVPRLAQDSSPLRAELAGMRAAARLNDPRTYSSHNTNFHRAIVVASGNPALLTAWESLGVEARLLITTLTTVDDLKKAAERHAPILAAAEANEIETVCSLLREHQNVYEELPHDQAVAIRSGPEPVS